MSANGLVRVVVCASRCKSGSANAAVFPVPVAARPMMSRPSISGGIASRWMGVGSSYSRALSFSTMRASSPSLANPDSGAVTTESTIWSFSAWNSVNGKL